MARRTKKEVNVFERAEAEAQAQAASESAVKPGSLHVPDLKKLVALNVVIKTLQTLYSTEEARVKSVGLEEAVKRGHQAKAQPDNFDLIEDDVAANFQVKKRSSNSPLKDEELPILQKYSISFEKVVSKERMFGINPKHAENQNYLKLLSKAIVKLGLPEDFIVMQTEIAKHVTTAQSISEAFNKINDVDDLKAVLPVLCSLALKVKDDGDTREAFKIVQDILED